MVALFLFVNGIQSVSKRGLEEKVDKQQELIQTHQEKDMVEQKIIEALEEERDEAKTDLERSEEEKEKLNEEIEQKNKELKAKLERDRLAKLASTRTVSTPSVVATNKTSSVAPVQSAPVVATQSVGYSADGNTYPYAQCTWGVDHYIGVPNYLGDAKNWGGGLLANGYRQTGPQINSVIVLQAGAQGAHGYYGHVGWVSSINSNGTVTMASTNWAGSGAGVAYATINPNAWGTAFYSR